MQSYAKSALILALIHTSMHIGYLESKIELKEIHTNLRNLRNPSKPEFPAQA